MPGAAHPGRLRLQVEHLAQHARLPEQPPIPPRPRSARSVVAELGDHAEAEGAVGGDLLVAAHRSAPASRRSARASRKSRRCSGQPAGRVQRNVGAAARPAAGRGPPRPARRGTGPAPGRGRGGRRAPRWTSGGHGSSVPRRHARPRQQAVEHARRTSRPPMRRSGRRGPGSSGAGGSSVAAGTTGCAADSGGQRAGRRPPRRGGASGFQAASATSSITGQSTWPGSAGSPGRTRSRRGVPRPTRPCPGRGGTATGR